MKKIIRYAAFSDAGKVRSKNQDNLYWTGQIGIPEILRGMSRIQRGTVTARREFLCAVFDGMGGEKEGGTASGIAVEIIAEMEKESSEWKKRFFTERFLKECCYRANESIDSYRRKKKYKAMGTTAAMIAVVQNKVTICNVGDSRIYCYSNHTLRQLSTDHTESRSLFRNAPLTQYLGVPEEEMRIEPEVSRKPYRAGDQYLLCTDGIWNSGNDQVISGILEMGDDLEKKLEKIFKMASEYDGRDNATAILIELV